MASSGVITKEKEDKPSLSKSGNNLNTEALFMCRWLAGHKPIRRNVDGVNTATSRQAMFF
jgi:hypothetical protein